MIEVTVFAALVLAWGYHVIWTCAALSSAAGATAGQIVLGVLGVLVPPVGIANGFVRAIFLIDKAIVWFASGVVALARTKN